MTEHSSNQHPSSSSRHRHRHSLNGRKVLIFGGSAGLGFGAATICLENGMTVIIASSSEARVDKAIARILQDDPSAQDRVSGYACDLGEQVTLERNIVELFEKVGVVDHIIYSAGDSLTAMTTPLSQISVDFAVRSHMVRYFAPMMIGKHAAKFLSPGPQSSLTLTSGAITLRPIPDWVLANGVMNAVHGLAQQLALELAPIRVNTVLPGFVDTEMWNDTMNEEEFGEMKRNMEKTMLTQRVATPIDVAEAYLYTLKDLNLTGAVIKTDGGAVLK